MPSAASKPTSLQHTIASQLGSAASTILLYPVDVVRMRYMSQDGTATRQHNGQTYRNVAKAFRVIYREEGGLRPFFRGCHVSVLGSVCAWGIYMYTYRFLCSSYASLLSWRERRLNWDSDEMSSVRRLIWLTDTWTNLIQRFGLSMIASCISAIFCNPIWLLKTRMQLEEASARVTTTERHFATFRHGLTYTVQTSGVRSLWRGVSAQLLLALPNACNLPLYDTIKATVLRASGRSELSVVEVSLCSTVAKVSIVLLSQPILVLKTRMQDHRARLGDVQYRGLVQSLQTVYRRDGLLGFYRGTLPSLCQAVPRSVMMFVFYEKFLKLAQLALPSTKEANQL